MKRVLFVCLGNICRSPTAEGIFRKLVEEAGLEDEFTIDSAGTGDWHAGDLPDRRMRAAAKKRGYTLESIARQVDRSDFERFDHIIAMDTSNRDDLLELCPPPYHDKISMLRDWDDVRGDPNVPDPYYGGGGDFDTVLDIAERCCRRLLHDLK
jgi:protein-tyrosine phosphatase